MTPHNCAPSIHGNTASSLTAPHTARPDLARRAWLGVCVTATCWRPSLARADQRAPDVLIREVSSEVIEIVKADAEIQAGNIDRIIALVDDKLMPHVNFSRMTAIAVGRPWRSATPQQRERLEAEFKTLLVRTYAGALTQVKDQTLQLRPVRATADATDLVVRSEVRGKGTPIQIDYRMEKTSGGWKIYDVNVLGVWLADTSFRSQFAPVLASGGVDGLISTLQTLNRQAGHARR